jgi:hypothetical protein
MGKLLLVFLISAIFSSCYTYRIFPREYRQFEYSGEKETAFITNPGLKKEYEIIKKSGIFIITNDRLDKSAMEIKLYPLKTSFVCGQPITGALLTLGQVPVYLPDRYQFQFDEIRKGEKIQKQFELTIATRYWFWDMFVFKKKFNQKAGQVMLAKYYMQQKPPPITGLRRQG